MYQLQRYFHLYAGFCLNIQVLSALVLFYFRSFGSLFILVFDGVKATVLVSSR